MATNYLVLGQTSPSASTNTTLYTAPSSTQAIVSTVNVCNRGTATANFRIAVRPDGAALSDQHYVAYNIPIIGEDAKPWTVGITMGDTDVITVWASSSLVSFAAFGAEITAS